MIVSERKAKVPCDGREYLLNQLEALSARALFASERTK
jgi:hypothetical protein